MHKPLRIETPKTSTAHRALSIRQAVRRSTYVLLCAVLLCTGCQKSADDTAESRGVDETSATENAPMDDSSAGESSAGASSAGEGAEADAHAPTPWTLEHLRTVLASNGWRIDDAPPALPDVATPNGTDVDGMTIQKDRLRADVFLYQYPRAGYAHAHASAVDSLAHTAIVQQDARLLVVVSRDRAQAQAVLDALPLDEAP